MGAEYGKTNPESMKRTGLSFNPSVRSANDIVAAAAIKILDEETGKKDKSTLGKAAQRFVDSGYIVRSID